MATNSSSRPYVALVTSLALALAMPLLMPATPTDAASPKACVVKNTKRGGTYGSLAAAIKRAKNKDKLTVRGICPGRARIINKKLTIAGVRTRTSGPPTLKGSGKAPVLYIAGDFANVTLKKLTVKGKATQVLDFDGGGIWNGARLTLQDVTVKDFKTKRYGGGIHNLEGTLRLLGTTRIRGNKGDEGAGIHNNSGTVVLGGSSSVVGNKGVGIKSDGKFSALHMRWNASVRNNSDSGVSSGLGVVTMSGNSAISGNTADEGAGFNGSSSLTMSGTSSITGNSAAYQGGGVQTGGELTMDDASSITGNSATYSGGGIYAFSWATLDGVVCDTGTGGNVAGNTPDNCSLD